jgi:hypothetical protein
METYTTSKGETMLISEMDNFHLVNALAKVANKTVFEDKTSENYLLLKALKDEVFKRLAPKE